MILIQVVKLKGFYEFAFVILHVLLFVDLLKRVHLRLEALLVVRLRFRLFHLGVRVESSISSIRFS